MYGYGVYPDDCDYGAAERERKRMRALLGVGDPITPHRIVNPLPLCEPRPNCWAHSMDRSWMRIRYSGCFRCTRCGFSWESTYRDFPPSPRFPYGGIISNGFVVLDAGNAELQTPVRRTSVWPREKYEAA